MFIRFDRIYERDGHTHIDRQTDGQTPHGDIGRACIASRGKNHMATVISPEKMPSNYKRPRYRGDICLRHLSRVITAAMHLTL